MDVQQRRSMDALASFFDAVSEERYAQLKKWGDQRHPDGTSEDLKGLADTARRTTQAMAAQGAVTWAVILEEEVGEAVAEVDPAKLKAELIQVAAVCAAWIDDIDRRS